MEGALSYSMYSREYGLKRKSKAAGGSRKQGELGGGIGWGNAASETGNVGGREESRVGDTVRWLKGLHLKTGSAILKICGGESKGRKNQLRQGREAEEGKKAKRGKKKNLNVGGRQGFLPQHLV